MNRLRPWLVFRKQLGLTQSKSYQSIRRFNLKQKEDSDYNVILPTEPYVWGVSHIQPRLVPDHIVKPPYARGIQVPTEEIPQGRGKIELGGEAELKIREAAMLAKKVREFAGTQVKVRLRLSKCERMITVAETDLQYRLEQLRTL
jgi:methionyl aminopeptidase